jgi:Uma2 family endonuclease
VRVQNPVEIPGYDEPEPDLAIVHLRPDRYRQRHPRPEDVVLVVEVADTTAQYDREVKIPLYARAGIPEAWLVDLTADRLEVFGDCRGVPVKAGSLPPLGVREEGEEEWDGPDFE